ncbi:MAG: hypothetical protein ACYDG2_09435 [Ruminiclostridium sp.]
MRRGSHLIGLLLIAIGAVVLVLKTVFDIRIFEFDSYDFWVFIVLLVGLAFELGFFLTRSKPGLLIPGGIVTTIALLFMFEVTTDWYFAEYTWPVYILSVAIGLFQMYLFSKREKGLLISSLIVGGIAAFCGFSIIISQLTADFIELFIPVSLIAGGIALFFSNSSKKKSQY